MARSSTSTLTERQASGLAAARRQFVPVRSCALGRNICGFVPQTRVRLAGCREPIYPSAEVSFEVGASPDALHQCGGRFKVQPPSFHPNPCAPEP